MVRPSQPHNPGTPWRQTADRRRWLTAAAITGALAVGALSAACGEDSSARQVTVQSTDSTYTAPAKLSPGKAAFRLENDGKDQHDLILIRLDADGTVQQALESQGKEGGTALGLLIAEAGSTSRGALRVTLSKGRYAIVDDSNGADGAPRFTQGFVAEFEVS